MPSHPADRPPGEASSFLQTACRPDVVRRALGYAVGVGAILIAINHGDAILAGRVTTGHVLKMVLTVCVPYCVSTASSVGALRGGPTRAIRDDA